MHTAYQSKGRADVVDEGGASNALDAEPVVQAEEQAPGGVKWMLAATLVSGIAGFVVMWLAYQQLGPEGYVLFGVFWSALFLVVGVLFGIQQESTRATAEALLVPQAERKTRSSMWIFGVGAGLIVGVLVLATSVLWAPGALGAENSGLALQVALGSAANAVVAAISGALAGAQRWRLLAAVIALDGLIRLLAVGVVLSITDDPQWLACAVILPFVLATGIVFSCAPAVMRTVGRSPLRYSQLAANSVHTIVAASATAILINGFPLVLAYYATQNDAATLAALIFAITLTRAPILMPMMALQSYLVTRFTNDRQGIWKLLYSALGLIALAMAALALGTWWLGEWAFTTFVRADFELTTAALVPLVVSSGFIGMLCVTGPALLALGRHRDYMLGWGIASLVALAVLFVPVPLEYRASLALSVGPIAGILWHLVAVKFAIHSPSSAKLAP